MAVAGTRRADRVAAFGSSRGPPARRTSGFERSRGDRSGCRLCFRQRRSGRGAVEAASTLRRRELAALMRARARRALRSWRAGNGQERAAPRARGRSVAFGAGRTTLALPAGRSGARAPADRLLSRRERSAAVPFASAPRRCCLRSTISRRRRTSSLPRSTPSAAVRARRSTSWQRSETRRKAPSALGARTSGRLRVVCTVPRARGRGSGARRRAPARV